MKEKDRNMVRKAITKASIYLGGRKADLARALKVNRSLVSRWANGQSKISLSRAIQIEKITSGSVKIEDLMPDFRNLRK